MEHDHFLNRSRYNFFISLHDGMQVEIAHGAAGESSKLQMHKPLPVRDPDAVRMDCDQFVWLYNGAGLNP
jgi:hypothetical protein